MNPQTTGEGQGKTMEVETAINALEHTTERLQDLSQMLVCRLEQVTCSATPKVEEEKRQEYGTPLAERLAKIDEGLDIAGWNLQSILDRLQI